MALLDASSTGWQPSAGPAAVMTSTTSFPLLLLLNLPCARTEEAQRLQALEVALLGASSTGWQPSTGPREPMPSALSAPAAPFAWSWRDTPVPAQPSLVPQPAVAVGALSFGAGVAPPGGFVFGARSPLAGAPGGAPASGDMAMES